jgi:hypothetical protein
VAPAQAVAEVSIKVAQVIDLVNNWLTGLPANPISDFLSGALLLVRRAILPVTLQNLAVIPIVTVSDTDNDTDQVVEAVEPEPGAPGNAVFTVTLATAYQSEVVVHYETGSDSNPDTTDATPGQDYTPVSGMLTFAPGETTKQVSVPITGDLTPEQAESFTLRYFAVAPTANAGAGTQSGLLATQTATIYDPDVYAPDSLAGANLTNADLTGANLQGYNLFGTILTGANLTNANLSGTKLSGADLTNANLTGANLYGTVLSGADLTNVTLTGANLTFADLSGANLRNDPDRGQPDPSQSDRPEPDRL